MVIFFTPTVVVLGRFLHRDFNIYMIYYKKDLIMDNKYTKTLLKLGMEMIYMKDVVKEYYNNTVQREHDRLDNPYSNIEFEITNYLIDKYIPKIGSIFDVGCGSGRYTKELIGKGYSVSIMDLSEKLINFAVDFLKESDLEPTKVVVDSAVNLHKYNDEKYNGILVLGPMYHLHEFSNRALVLEGVKKLLKPDGIAIISYINSFGILRASVTEFPDEFVNNNYLGMIQKGSIALSEEESFTKTYFSNVEDAKNDIIKAGFKIESIAGAESFLSGLSHQMKEMFKSNINLYNGYIEEAKKACEFPHYRETTEHILFIIRKS